MENVNESYMMSVQRVLTNIPLGGAKEKRHKKAREIVQVQKTNGQKHRSVERFDPKREKRRKYRSRKIGNRKIKSTKGPGKETRILTSV